MPERTNPKKRKSLTSGEDLYQQGLIQAEAIPEINSIGKKYKIRAPTAYVDKINKSDPNDPLRLTIVPTAAEKKNFSFELIDPIGDYSHSPVKGLVHRHADRVLFMPTNICAMYCRFCFRRNSVGKTNLTLKPTELEAALTYIQAHKEVWEVILTGGDPFVLSNNKLQAIMSQLAAIEHVKVIRFHTRIFIAEPQRIDKKLIRIFKRFLGTGKAVYIVTHINHLNEINQEMQLACAKLLNIGVPFLNQTVLLKNINDDSDKLTALFKKLVELRIKPYYLHHLDLASGTQHFRTSIEDGQKLIKTLRLNISGLAVPTYMLDIPGGYNKIPIEPLYLRQDADGVYFMEDTNGIRHQYIERS